MKDDYALRAELERFLKVCKDAGLAWQFIDGHIKRCEDKTQDFLHALELRTVVCGDYAERARAEGDNRRERREYKDEKAILTPLMAYLDTPAGKAALQCLQRVLGDIRKEEKHQATRIYRQKALEDCNRDLLPPPILRAANIKTKETEKESRKSEER